MGRSTFHAFLLLAAASAAALLLFDHTARSADGLGWTQLWNGTSLDGWEHVGPGGFAIENGLLKSEGGMGLLWYTKRKFGSGDTLRVVFKTGKNDSNSGVFIRFPEAPKDPWYPIHFGYEVQIDNAEDDYHCTGVIYSMTKALARPQKAPGEWNTMEITLRGDETIVKLNGVLITDFHDRAATNRIPPRKHWYEGVRGPRAESGYMGVQNHDNGSSVYFKEVSFRHGN